MSAHFHCPDHTSKKGGCHNVSNTVFSVFCDDTLNRCFLNGVSQNSNGLPAQAYLL